MHVYFFCPCFLYLPVLTWPVGTIPHNTAMLWSTATISKDTPKCNIYSDLTKKQTPWTLRNSPFSRQIGPFFRQFWIFEPAKKKNFKNVIFIGCQWCEICKYYVYSIVISLSPVKRKKIYAFWWNIWFTLFCRIFKFVFIYAGFFLTKSVFLKSKSSQKKVIFPCLHKFRYLEDFKGHAWRCIFSEVQGSVRGSSAV